MLDVMTILLRSMISMAPGTPETITSAAQPECARMPIAAGRILDLRYHRCLESAVLQWVATYGYFAIFGLLTFGIVGVPVPDEFLLTGCGFLIYRGDLHAIPAFASALAGSMCGITCSYIIGSPL